jgi:hypothetical protein
MLRSFFVCAFVGLLLILSSNGFAGSYLSSGVVNSSSGTPDKDLTYEDFEITPDGFITGFIVNTSGRSRPGVTLDFWTTNMQETRIFWRKTVNVGDIAPNAKARIREPYPVKDENPSKTKFMFRLPSAANFRNKAQQ